MLMLPPLKKKKNYEIYILKFSPLDYMFFIFLTYMPNFMLIKYYLLLNL